MKKIFIIIAAVFFMLPQDIFAHGGHGTGFMAGLTHPIFGLDHLVAIIGIGILGYTLLKENPWLPSLFFVIAMIIGGILGIGATAFGLTEYVIVGSVLITGLLIAFEVPLSLIFYAILAAGFGFFHGHAHGTEMPEASNILLYILGFVTGAGLLSITGFGLVRYLREIIDPRLLGAFIAGMGLMMFLG